MKLNLYGVCFPSSRWPLADAFPQISRKITLRGVQEKEGTNSKVWGSRKGLDCHVTVPNSFLLRVRELPREIPSVLRNEQRKKNGA